MSRNGFWFSVVEGSTLTIRTRGKTANDTQFIGGARHVPSAGPISTWDINPGPKVEVLAGDVSHIVRVGFRIPVEKKQTLQVVASLTKPDGSVHKDSDGNDEFIMQLSGKKNDGMLRGNLIFVDGD